MSFVDLCADVMGYDFSLANYEHHFITRGRKQAIIYGTDEVNLESRSVSYLRFSSSATPISCRIYNKYDYKVVLGIFWRYVSEEYGYTAVEQVTEEDILGWLAHMRNSHNHYGRPYSSRTIATYNRNVLTFFHWLVDHRYLEVDPTIQLREVKIR